MGIRLLWKREKTGSIPVMLTNKQRKSRAIQTALAGHKLNVPDEGILISANHKGATCTKVAIMLCKHNVVSSILTGSILITCS